MSNYKKMQDNLTKMQEIKSGIAGELRNYQEIANDMFKKVDANQDLSPTGRLKQKEQLKYEMGKSFLKKAKELKDEYQKAVVSAKIGAEMLLNERPKKPSSDTTIQTFTRQFTDLKMKLMLNTRAEQSMKDVSEFIRTQKDPYFAQQIIDEFPSLVGSVLDSSGNDKTQYKAQLQHALLEAKNIAQTPEQKEAQGVFENIDNEFSRDLFARGLHMDVVTDTFGSEIAGYVNRPDSFDFSEEEEAE